MSSLKFCIYKLQVSYFRIKVNSKLDRIRFCRDFYFFSSNKHRPNWKPPSPTSWSLPTFLVFDRKFKTLENYVYKSFAYCLLILFASIYPIFSQICPHFTPKLWQSGWNQNFPDPARRPKFHFNLVKTWKIAPDILDKLLLKLRWNLLNRLCLIFLATFCLILEKGAPSRMEERCEYFEAFEKDSDFNRHCESRDLRMLARCFCSLRYFRAI